MAAAAELFNVDRMETGRYALKHRESREALAILTEP